MAANSSTGHPSIAQKRTTAAELMQLPDDGNRYELVRGGLVAMAPAGFLHGVIVDRIGRRIGDYVEQHSLGVSAAAETGFQIERDVAGCGRAVGMGGRSGESHRRRPLRARNRFHIRRRRHAER